MVVTAFRVCEWRSRSHTLNAVFTTPIPNDPDFYRRRAQQAGMGPFPPRSGGSLSRARRGSLEGILAGKGCLLTRQTRRVGPR